MGQVQRTDFSLGFNVYSSEYHFSVNHEYFWGLNEGESCKIDGIKFEGLILLVFVHIFLDGCQVVLEYFKFDVKGVAFIFANDVYV